MWSRRRKDETAPAAPAPDPGVGAPAPPDDALAGRGPVPPVPAAASATTPATVPWDDPLAGLDLEQIRATLEELAEAHGAADPDGESAGAVGPALPRRRRRGRRRSGGRVSAGTAAPDAAVEAGPGRAAATRWGGRRRVSGVALAVAAALAGSITTSRTGMLDGASSEADDTIDTELAGTLPFQEDDLAEMELELAAFEDPELLEDVPVNEEEVSDEVEEVLEGTEVIETLGESGIPEVAIEAYMDGADLQADVDPECGIRWTLLAATGRVESNHGRFGGAQLREDGYGTKPIRGIPLDGRPNVALIRDTDGGALDGDTTYDRAVGPMQFIPSTWKSVGQDANDDGRADPNNMFDAAQGAGAYLCAGGGSLEDTAGRARAVRRYNNAESYVQMVLRLAMLYETGEVQPLPDLPATPPPASTPSAPRPPTPTPPVTRPTTPTRPTPPPTTVPRPRPPVTVPPTTTPTTTPPTTVPAPPTTVPTPPTTVPTTEPPVDPPETTVPPVPPPGELPAAVGWAPAMREVVVDILTPDECPIDGDGDEAEDAPDEVAADEATPPDGEVCVPPGSDAVAAPPPDDEGDEGDEGDEAT